ncbi:unnamed protein product, partial [Mesorhabditis spiculigera]
MLHPPLRVSIKGTSREVLLIVKTALVFSHRQLANARHLSVASHGINYTIQRQPVTYLRVPLPLTLGIPQKLNFRSNIIITPIVTCTQKNTIRCLEVGACISNHYHCDGSPNCLKKSCKKVEAEVVQRKQHNSYQELFVEYSPFTSSQAMLIGFFVMNLSFIVFFVLLSICSTSPRLSRIVFRPRSKCALSYVQLMR